MINGIKIMSLEGSDILKDNIDGKEIIKEYKTVLPYSLVVAKLNRLHIKHKNNKSIDFIGVNFNYGYDTKEVKEYKEKMQNIRELKKSINIAKKKQDTKEEQELLKQLQLQKDLLEQLQLNFNFKAEKKKWDKDSIREKMYDKGFTLKHKYMEKGKEVEKTITYLFWFRTPAKSRCGDSIFINAELLGDISEWQDMGLILPEGETKVVEFQAYRSLTASNIEDTITINPKNILVVNDLDSYMDTNIISVETNTDGECVAIERKDKVKNTLWDGMALLDSSYFKEGHNFYLLRNHFFKSCAFSTNIVMFLKDKYGDEYDTAQVKDRYGNNIRVKNIRLITTENSMKWEKFAECGAINKDGVEITSKKQMFGYWKRLVKEDRYLFGICKHNHSSKYGDYQRMSYQMVNTLLATPEQTKDLAQYTVDYINKLKDDDTAFVQMLRETATNGNNNSLYVDLYNKNVLFKESDTYKRFKTETISSIKKRARTGKILVEGDNLTVCGNPYVLLLHAVGEVPNINNIIEEFTDVTLPVADNYISCYTERFLENEELAGFRNPHNAPNNIAFFKNNKNDLLKKYFNFGKNVIAVNLINTELQDLANGLDEDSDFMLVTNNNVAVECTKKIFRSKDYVCVVNNIPKDNKKWINNNINIAKIDNLLAKSKNVIGVTSNLAQLSLSYYQATLDKELRDIVCIASVLAQVAIDNSKRRYLVDLDKEINKIKKLDCIKKYKGKYPNWFKYIKDLKPKRLLQENECDCTMQYLQTTIDTVKNNFNNKDNLKATDLLKNIKMDGDTNYPQIEIIQKLIRKYDNKVKRVNDLAEKYKWKEEKIEEQVRDVRDNTFSRIGSFKLTQETMHYLVKNAIIVKEQNDEEKMSDEKKCNRKILNVLYNTHKDLFLSVWEEAKKVQA